MNGNFEDFLDLNPMETTETPADNKAEYKKTIKDFIHEMAEKRKEAKREILNRMKFKGY